MLHVTTVSQRACVLLALPPVKSNHLASILAVVATHVGVGDTFDLTLEPLLRWVGIVCGYHRYCE